MPPGLGVMNAANLCLSAGAPRRCPGDERYMDAPMFDNQQKMSTGRKRPGAPRA
jgi:hypothetical protein